VQRKIRRHDLQEKFGVYEVHCSGKDHEDRQQILRNRFDPIHVFFRCHRVVNRLAIFFIQKDSDFGSAFSILRWLGNLVTYQRWSRTVKGA